MARQTKKRRTSKPGSAPRRPLGLIAAGIAVVLALVVWVPSLLSRGQLPAVGKTMADFVAEDSEGNRFHLAEAYRDNYLIVVFYRGYG